MSAKAPDLATIVTSALRWHKAQPVTASKANAA